MLVCKQKGQEGELNGMWIMNDWTASRPRDPRCHRGKQAVGLWRPGNLYKSERRLGLTVYKGIPMGAIATGRDEKADGVGDNYKK